MVVGKFGTLFLISLIFALKIFCISHLIWFRGGSMSDEFYSLFYLGLYCESIGEDAKAANYMIASTKTDYARGRGAADYMTSCARVHCQLRHWT